MSYRTNTGSAKPPYLRLGVNIDYVATIRNARGGVHPDPLRAAQLAVEAGADGITAHLREDRRHISDGDIARLMAELKQPLNLEMAATDEMLEVALRHKPNACCIVPERRQELTTEGGLDVGGHSHRLRDVAAALKDAGIRVSFFVNADSAQIEKSYEVGAEIVELHTGAYCESILERQKLDESRELVNLRRGAELAADIGLEVHAGHGLTFDTVGQVAQIPQIVELNIGHFLIGEAIFGGLHSSVRRMRALMDNAREAISGSASA